MSSLSFATPLALVGLLALPLIWWLLRATPPRPQTIRFPPLRLLLQLINRQEQPDKTPWWLMLLRLSLVTALILAVAHPFLQPDRVMANRNAPLLLVIDDDWAAARTWNERRALAQSLITVARDNNQTVTIATTAPRLHPPDLRPLDADAAQNIVTTLEPQALTVDRAATLNRLTAQFSGIPALHVTWLSNGLDQASATRFAAGLAGLAQGNATVDVVQGDEATLPLAFAAPKLNTGQLTLTLQRSPSGTAQDVQVSALAGTGRSLGEAKLSFSPGATTAEATLDLPIELRNQIQRVEIADQHHAAATFLFDDRWRRKTVALQSGSSFEAAQPLLDPLYYVSRALEPSAQVSTLADLKDLSDRLTSGLSMLVLADIGVIPEAEQQAITPWLERGGLLLRFAGPRLAAGHDAMIPVTLREGGRALGSVLSWEKPQTLQAFPATSPFAGLAADPTVTVSRQVLAEPTADLPGKVWASLADGTPLVTATHVGKGQIVLVHVTANADWSNLALSGLFVEMLRQITDLAPAAGGVAATAPTTSEQRAQTFTPRLVLSGTGTLMPPDADAKPVTTAEMQAAVASPQTPPGLYQRDTSERAINQTPPPEALVPITTLPAGVTLHSMKPPVHVALAPALFTLALILFLIDTLVSLWMNGAWHRLRHTSALLLIVIALLPPQARADAADDAAIKATEELHLAYVETGDASVDAASAAGLRGLSTILTNRTSVEPGEPLPINIERDEIVFFPLLYWPVTDTAPLPSPAALAKMDAYMKNGGTIFFDLRDGSDGASTPLRNMLAKLDIPALEPVPATHVLTKSFYLLDVFPGRYAEGKLWVERSDPGEAATMDGVSSIIIGSNDYAAAWAMDATGQPLYATVPPDDHQRELAYRTGVNIVMYALTGNYKADQVHMKAIIERLGH